MYAYQTHSIGTNPTSTAFALNLVNHNLSIPPGQLSTTVSLAPNFIGFWSKEGMKGLQILLWIPSGGFHSASETQVATPAFHAGEFPVNRNNYATVDDEAMETSIGRLGQVPDKDFEELRRQLALYDEE
ncbi:hypothetical protein BT96DRAFT_939386 [Gymnopus androsaceus JB14]|uniref:Uncharacterized protein n=1 Tax=Gymnopus androsaceus JB14 TaxID=1447944 RepID=A0A6A4HN66_9AGAR|nr:hypothetical protein BT96DRAFT_939386 [Gymnopus androsaceus JB14]